MKSLSKIFITILAALSITTVSYAASTEKITSGTDISPKENTFRVVGSETEFILLDVSEDLNSKFLIMAKSYFPRREYGTAQRFDPDISGSLARFLNKEFLEEGAKDSFTNKVYSIPSEVVAHIDKNHMWETEAGNPSGNCPERYVVKAGVVVPSQEEYIKYQDKIGMTDDFDTLVHTPKFSGWWTRTGAAGKDMISVRPVSGKTQTYTWTSNDAGLNFRPMFWVDVDFFSDVKIDVETVGENVLKEIKKYYSVDQLKKLYPLNRIYDYLGYTPEVSVGNVKFFSDGKNITNLTKYVSELTIRAEFTNNLSNAVSGNAIAVKYTSGGFPRQMVSVPLSVNPGATEKQEFVFKFRTPPLEGEYVKVFYSALSDRTATTSNSVIIGE